jgi:hypothetical protein
VKSSSTNPDPPKSLIKKSEIVFLSPVTKSETTEEVTASSEIHKNICFGDNSEKIDRLKKILVLEEFKVRQTILLSFIKSIKSIN